MTLPWLTIRHVTLRLKPTLDSREFLALSIADRIRFVVELAGMTQDQFANEIGTDRETVNKWVNGKREPSPEYAAKLEEISTIPAGWFRTSRARRDAAAELQREVAALRLLMEDRLPSRPDQGLLLAELEGLRADVAALRQDLADALARIDSGSEAAGL